METNQQEQTRGRKAIIAIAVLAVAMAASLFVTTTSADARPTDYQNTTQTDKGGEAESDPWTTFCLATAEAEDFAACEAAGAKDDGRTASQLAVKDVRTRAHHGPTNWFCPVGTVATAFEMPIYDVPGLFVVGYETVWFCIDANTQPVG
jgi:hypothetical protein